MPKRIAIVEDEAELASLIDYNLKRHGYETQIFNGSKGTLKTLEQHKPDLVVLDLMMPDMDGFTLLQMIRDSIRWRSLPVIVLTGYTDQDVFVERTRELKIQESIPKTSLGSDYLLTRVRQHLPAVA